ncbi:MULTISPECIES: cupin domain-containing protein [unclassified Modicisalibacter]|uniref:cupin domain-containing protein n=1 Tax=unclassified Modicisalibacter TaxID=2679913 RepID=UPI001CCA66A7|nr:MULTISPECIES: cupin domain-containing protein [unclassified Modicisalibacter]MBZ9559866.1 cupin domain-containing protein [Modicisalibacter sp. R2A 31.J]MBZ9577318.1 cupin domain-containing protein [Modicisalibacter sp. MOD 31.J]
MQNLFTDVPERLDEECFETILENSAVTVERIVSKGHRSPASGWYDQDRDEWVVVLQGRAVLAFEQGADMTLAPGDHVVIPAHRRHRVAWTDPDVTTIWLAVHY